MAPPLLRLSSIEKGYRRGTPQETLVLEDISLDIGAGEITVIKGPSGSGKTTLLSIAGCMLRPDAGRVLLDGEDVTGLPEQLQAIIRRTRFGFIFQHLNLIPDLPVLDNVVLPLLPSPIGRRELHDRAVELLEWLGLQGKEGLKVRDLSGGEGQRVAIARALINDPDIVVADEPTAHLDPDRSTWLVNMLLELASKGKAVLIATHDPIVFLEKRVGRVFHLSDGSLHMEVEGGGP